MELALLVKFYKRRNKASSLLLCILYFAMIFIKQVTATPFPDQVGEFFDDINFVPLHRERSSYVYFPYRVGYPYYHPRRGSGNQQQCCQGAGVPCSGYTATSCLTYCNSKGFPLGECSGECCLCSHQPMPKSDFERKPSTQEHKTDEILDVAESRRPYSVRSIGKHSFNKNSLPGKVETKVGEVDFTKTFSGKGTTSSKPSLKSICHSKECLDSSAQILANMNPDVNPCDNFYEFACGGLIRDGKIPEDQVEVTSFSSLRNKIIEQVHSVLQEPIKAEEPKPFKLAKTLYKSCMNTDLVEQKRLEPMNVVIKVMGGWPVVTGRAWRFLYASWSNYAIWLRELGFAHGIFMSMSVERDIKNSKLKKIMVGEPELGLPREALLKGFSDPIVKAYYNYMIETAVLFGANKELAERDMYQVLLFEMQLAKIIYRPRKSRRGTFYSPATIAEMEYKYSSVPWLEFFQRFSLSNAIIGPNEVIILSAPHYLQKFLRLVELTDSRVIANYAIWRMVSSGMVYLNKEARQLQFSFKTIVTGQSKRLPRWKECTEVVSGSLGNGVGSMYVRRYFDESSKVEATLMIQNIQKAFTNILDELQWMDLYTKEKAKEKAMAMTLHVGYPKEHLDDSKITKLYSEYEFKETEYFENVRNLIVAATNMTFRKLRDPFSDNWVTYGKNAVVNAFYMPLENAIQFPAGVLQPPFFQKNRPKYMNYGSIGWIMGHEITHGFDDQGHEFDSEGNLRNWWNPFTKQTYASKTKCIIQQYEGFRESKTNLKLNGVSSQGENIADNGGIKQAYRAYLTWIQQNGEEMGLPGLDQFTPKQLFWLAAANNWCSLYRAESLKSQITSGVHSPGEFRVRGSFANTKEFSIDFNCPVDSSMNPRKKCDIW